MGRFLKMKHARNLLFFCTLLLFGMLANGQAVDDSTKSKFADKVRLRGYVKNMQTFQAASLDYLAHGNLIHNRLNFRVYPNKQVSMGLEVRNRVFSGDLVNLDPNYTATVDVDNGLVDLSWAWLDTPGLVGLTQIDRAWMKWTNAKWDVTMGRQRINWGVNAFWNSNDLFNTFNVADFDYEERPGTDAIRVQRFLKNYASLEVAIAPALDKNEWVGAAMYKFNKWTYDFQAIGGWWNKDVVIGAGWAGNLKTAGFKGEVTYFHPQEMWQDSVGTVSASISFDYMFKTNTYAMMGLMYGSSGMAQTLNINDLTNLSLGASALPSAKNLMPTKYNLLLSVSQPLTPLINASLVAIYSPGVDLLFAMPSVSMSVASNWDLSLFGQTTFLDNGSDFKNYGTSIFVRLKYGF
jgi:hypothetical protein